MSRIQKPNGLTQTGGLPYLWLRTSYMVRLTPLTVWSTSFLRGDVLEVRFRRLPILPDRDKQTVVGILDTPQVKGREANRGSILKRSKKALDCSSGSASALRMYENMFHLHIDCRSECGQSVKTLSLSGGGTETLDLQFNEGHPHRSGRRVTRVCQGPHSTTRGCAIR